MLKATVSGSFHRHLGAVQLAVDELLDAGVKVLSPADPRVVDARGEFLFVASDRVRSIRLVQDRHLECVRRSDFLWLVAPDGYVGQSASMELGFAIASQIPVYCEHLPADLTLRQYVQRVPSLWFVLDRHEAHPRAERPDTFLIDPHASIGEAHDVLDRLSQLVADARGASAASSERLGQHISAERRDVSQLLTPIG